MWLVSGCKLVQFKEHPLLRMSNYSSVSRPGPTVAVALIIVIMSCSHIQFVLEIKPIKVMYLCFVVTVKDHFVRRIKCVLLECYIHNSPSLALCHYIMTS